MIFDERMKRVTAGEVQRQIAKKAPSMRAVETRYNAALQRWLRAFNKEVKTQAMAILAPMTREDALDPFSVVLQELVDFLAKLYLNSGLLSIVDNAASSVFAVNEKKYNTPLYSKLMINAVPAELTGDLRENWIHANTGLIKNVSAKELAQIQQLIRDNAYSGRRAKDLEAELDKIFGGSRKNIAVIARDQIGKLGGQLDMLKQTNAGIEGYYWRSARDERVRSSHASREGNYYSWKEPPADGHPGQAIMCRCDAEPALDRLFGDKLMTKEVQQDNAAFNVEAKQRSVAYQRELQKSLTKR